MTSRAGLVSYDGLPIGSGGGHGLGRRSAQQAWTGTLGFVRGCTTSVDPRRVTLVVNSVDDAEPRLPEGLLESAVATLGIERQPHERRDYGSGGRSQIWQLPPDQAPRAVAWLDSLGRLGTNWLGGPVVLWADFRIRFRAAGDGPELLHQGSASYLAQSYDGYGNLLGESVCRLTLSSRSTLSVLFFLPFETPGPDLWSYARFLQSRLPFRLSCKHWMHWSLARKGTSYVGRRIKNPELGHGESEQ